MLEFEFKQRPVDIPPDLRLYRRLAMLCIALSECCTNASASFRQLHFLNSAFIDEEFRWSYFDFRSQKHLLKLLSPSADPYLNRCANYAIGAALVEQKKIQNGFKLALTQKGRSFVEDLKEQKLVMDVFDTAATLGKISDSEVHRVMKLG